jgi:hypothetical protein
MRWRLTPPGLPHTTTEIIIKQALTGSFLIRYDLETMEIVVIGHSGSGIGFHNLTHP